MSAISPPPVGADAEETIQTDNQKALVALKKQTRAVKSGSVAAVLGSALALVAVGFVIATVGGKRSRFRRPWYFRFLTA